MTTYIEFYHLISLLENAIGSGGNRKRGKLPWGCVVDF